MHLLFFALSFHKHSADLFKQDRVTAQDFVVCKLFPRMVNDRFVAFKNCRDRTGNMVHCAGQIKGRRTLSALFTGQVVPFKGKSFFPCDKITAFGQFQYGLIDLKRYKFRLE